MKTMVSTAIITCCGFNTVFAITKYIQGDYQFSAFLAIAGLIIALIGFICRKALIN